MPTAHAPSPCACCSTATRTAAGTASRPSAPAIPAWPGTSPACCPGSRAHGAPGHLPLLDLCLPALRQLGGGRQRQAFLQLVGQLQEGSGGRMGCYCIASLLRSGLGEAPPQPDAGTVILSVQPLWPQLRVLLSALVRAGVAIAADAPGADPREAALAFSVAASRLLPEGAADGGLLAAAACGAGPLDAAFAALSRGNPGVRQRIIAACAWCVAADSVVTVAEAELLRVVSSCLDCPLPPFANAA